MAGLIDSTDGLEYGSGLIFEHGLGTGGLINPPYSGAVQFATVLFAGAGTLSALAVKRAPLSAIFAGTGTLTANGSVV